MARLCVTNQFSLIAFGIHRELQQKKRFSLTIKVGKLGGTGDVKLRSPNVLRNGRRCQSELASASTAELLAQFVASRLNDKPPGKEPTTTESATATAIHTPVPRSSQETTRPIMSVHKETGILQGRMI